MGDSPWPRGDRVGGAAELHIWVARSLLLLLMLLWLLLLVLPLLWLLLVVVVVVVVPPTTRVPQVCVICSQASVS